MRGAGHAGRIHRSLVCWLILVVDTSWKREPQMKICLHQVGVTACLVGHSLLLFGGTLGSGIPRQVDLGYLKNASECEPG